MIIKIKNIIKTTTRINVFSSPKKKNSTNNWAPFFFLNTHQRINLLKIFKIPKMKNIINLKYKKLKI